MPSSSLPYPPYIQRCLQLAELAKDKVFPNPMVGAVVVNNDKIIGEGFHQNYGAPHAEVNAIASVKDKSLLKDSTLYVNLEPCCHWGKTPPCTDLIINAGIKNVVIGSLDPNPLVAGKGVKILEEAGVHVTTGILEQECLDLNKEFFDQFKENKTVKFILKWAQSADGFIGKDNYDSIADREISNGLVKRYVHKLRSETDAIMIGTNTALVDNPVLDNRYWFGKAPIVVVIDRYLKIPLDFNLFKPGRKVIIINETREETVDHLVYKKILFGDDVLFWQTVNNKLIESGIHSALLEGGAKTIQSFLNSNIPCEIIRISAGKLFGNGIKAPVIAGNATEHFNLGDNLVEIFNR